MKFKRIHVVILLSLVLAAILGWAFGNEARAILRQPVSVWTEDLTQTVDCAVVLTGGPNRVREGIDLLSRKNIHKLIVSGVHPQARFQDIFPLWPYYGDLKESDVILERRSETTFGNAQQSLPLVEALRCSEIVLITSRVHMRRALKTFRAEFPEGFPIIPRAVPGLDEPPGKVEVAWETMKSLFYSAWAY